MPIDDQDSESNDQDIDPNDIQPADANLLQRGIQFVGSSVRGEDVEQIRSDCLFLTRYARPGVAPHHQVQALTSAGLAVGFFTQETLLMRATRSVMDSNTGPIQDLWRMVFPRNTVTGGVDHFMDTVPGQEYAGGMFHRLMHGHDLDALVSIWREYGLEGVTQWFNHTALRDFWTPHGLPYLPTGTESLFQWLVGKGVAKSLAANILSINAAEFFASLFFLRFAVTAARVIQQVRNGQRMRRLWEAAERYDQLRNFSAADHAYRDALELSGHHPAVLTHFAVRQLYAAVVEPEQAATFAHRAFQTANAVLRSHSSQTDTMPFHGTQISVRGLASYVLSASASGHLQYESSDLPDQLLWDGVESLTSTAESLRARRSVVLPSRPFGAALNDILAIELLSAIKPHPKLRQPIELRNRVLEDLATYRDQGSSRGRFASQLSDGIRTAYPLTV